MSSFALEKSLGVSLGVTLGDDQALANLLARLGGLPGSVWWDPAWAPGAFTQLDGATLRFTALLSRPLGAWAQYTISQGTLSFGPAVALSPNGKLIMGFAGAQFLSGAAGLAASLQGSAAYFESQIAIRTAAANTARWSATLNAATPDNRILHYVSAAGATNRWRIAAGSSAANTGATVTNGVPQTHSTAYSGTANSGWLSGAAETLSGAGANTRAPVALDMIDLGAARAAGVPQLFWQGSLTGLVIVPGSVSLADRAGIEADMSRYYGYA